MCQCVTRMSLSPFLSYPSSFLWKTILAASLTVGTPSAASGALFAQSIGATPADKPPQVANPAQSNKAEAAKPAQEKKDDAAQAAAKSNAHHFDRVIIIVLENGDYEVAVKDENLAALAAKGASFSNFHALFHPSYPNYLAMVAGTDFGIHGRGRYLADRQVNFQNDAAHKTIADRLIASGLDFKNYAEELPQG